METLERPETFTEENDTYSPAPRQAADWTESDWFQTWLELARGKHGSEAQTQE
jgi:hypothetical protein